MLDNERSSLDIETHQLGHMEYGGYDRLLASKVTQRAQNLPIRGKKLLTCLKTQTCISRADNGITEWNLVLASNLSNN